MTPEHEAIIARIESSAAAVRRAVGDAPPYRFGLAPKPGEWSAMETLTHLCQVVVHVYGTRIRRLMHETAAEFADFDEVSVRRASLARGDTQAALLETIVQEHLQLARLLRTLTTATWSREGRHPTLGPMSIEFLARRVGDHADEHAAQITAAAR
jgi:DinB superfamily